MSITNDDPCSIFIDAYFCHMFGQLSLCLMKMSVVHKIQCCEKFGRKLLNVDRTRGAKVLILMVMGISIGG